MRAPRRRLLVAATLTVLGSCVLLVAGGREWARVELAGVRATSAAVTGTDLVPLLGPAGVVGLAAVAALVATRGVARRVGGALVALAGAGVLVGTAVGTAPADVRAAAADSPGVTTTSAPARGGVDLTGWPAVGLAGGVTLLGTGALVVAQGHRWPGLSSRHERSPNSVPQHPEATAEQIWDSLDRGEDPTT